MFKRKKKWKINWNWYKRQCTKNRNLLEKNIITDKFFFFEQGKMYYINTAIAVSSAQDVPKKLLKNKQFTPNTKSVYPMPKHDKGLDHHKFSPNTKLAFLTFNHHKE